MLQDCGVSSHELTHLARWASVQEAAARLGSPGRRASASRIAAATGLTRADVRHLLADSAYGSTATKLLPRAADSVLAGWVTDPDFLDGAGKPRPLRYPASPLGFAELARRYARDIPPRAMLNELIESELIRKDEAGGFIPNDSVRSASGVRRNALDNFGVTLRMIGASLLQNLREADAPPHFDALVVAREIPPAKRARILRDLNRRCRTFALAVNRFLLDHTRVRDDSSLETESIGEIGIAISVINSRDASNDEQGA